MLHSGGAAKGAVVPSGSDAGSDQCSGRKGLGGASSSRGRCGACGGISERRSGRAWAFSAGGLWAEA
eukprot:8932954-Lingulodinium_polyedra.AAC.1